MSSDTILTDIETFLRKKKLSATRFGVLAAGDTKLVKTLRDGRRLRPKTEEAIRNFIRSYGRA